MATKAEKEAAVAAAELALAGTPAGLIASASGLSVTAINVAAFAASMSGMDTTGLAEANRGASDWVGGLKASDGPFSDVYTPSGELKTFLNGKGDRVAGRMVTDNKQKERKMYRKFLAVACANDAPGIVNVEIDGKVYPLLKGASFGIQASPDTDRAKESYNGGEPKHPLKHEYVAA